MENLDLPMDLIQLLKELCKVSIRRWESYQNACPGKLHPLNSLEELVLPKSYRKLRALAIASWFLPEWLQWEIRLSLISSHYSLDFNNKGLDQSLELRLLVTSQQVMLKYIKENLNYREVFGTILKEDLDIALKLLKIKECTRPKRKIRRKGYQDKGTWRPPHLWLEHYDRTFNVEQENIERKRLYIELLHQLISYKLIH